MIDWKYVYHTLIFWVPLSISIGIIDIFWRQHWIKLTSIIILTLFWYSFNFYIRTRLSLFYPIQDKQGKYFSIVLIGLYFLFFIILEKIDFQFFNRPISVFFLISIFQILKSLFTKPKV